jgi:hypothetical protein
MVEFSFSGAAILARRPFTKRALDLNIRDTTNQPVQFQPGIAAPCLRSRASATASVRAAALPGRSMPLWIIENLFAVGEMEIITRHGRTLLCGYNNIENCHWLPQPLLLRPK